MLILLRCSQYANTKKKLDFNCMLLICTGNMLCLERKKMCYNHEWIVKAFRCVWS